MSTLKGLSLALVFALTACAPVMPGLPSGGDSGTTTPSAGSGTAGTNPGGGAAGTIVGAPGPVAGVGLPILAVVGGLAWIKSRNRREDRIQR